MCIYFLLIIVCNNVYADGSPSATLLRKWEPDYHRVINGLDDILIECIKYSRYSSFNIQEIEKLRGFLREGCISYLSTIGLGLFLAVANNENTIICGVIEIRRFDNGMLSVTIVTPGFIEHIDIPGYEWYYSFYETLIRESFFDGKYGSEGIIVLRYKLSNFEGRYLDYDSVEGSLVDLYYSIIDSLTDGNTYNNGNDRLSNW